MRQLYIKQKVFSLSGKFTVKDQQEKDIYYVEGSFMQVPKTFSIMNTARDEVALITKKVLLFTKVFGGGEWPRGINNKEGIFLLKSTIYN